MHNVIYPPSSVVQNSFTALKILCIPLVHPFFPSHIKSQETADPLALSKVLLFPEYQVELCGNKRFPVESGFFSLQRMLVRSGHVVSVSFYC